MKNNKNKKLPDKPTTAATEQQPTAEETEWNIMQQNPFRSDKTKKRILNPQEMKSTDSNAFDKILDEEAPKFMSNGEEKSESDIEHKIISKSNLNDMMSPNNWNDVKLKKQYESAPQGTQPEKINKSMNLKSN